MKPLFTFDEVRERGLVVVGENVYDLRGFIARHPGGSDLARLQGMDATFPILNAHGCLGQLPRLPYGLCIGRIDEATLPATDRELRGLHASFVARGLFRYARRWLAIDVTRALGLFAAATLSVHFSEAIAFVLFTAALLNVMWWVHDVCHDSVFADRRTAKRYAELASVVFVGTPVLSYQYLVHRLHHGYTNVIGADQALHTGPVIWDARMRRRSVSWFVGVQAFAWFAVALPLSFPLFLGVALYDRVKDRDFAKIALVALRWGALWQLFAGYHFLLLGSTLSATYLLAFFSGLNHFHKPISDVVDRDFSRSMARVTQNLSQTGPLLTWLMGGLNFHIEHHFFATMPRRNYRVIAPDIRAFCTRHGLPYSTCTLGASIAALFRKLQSPYSPVQETPVAVSRP